MAAPKSRFWNAGVGSIGDGPTGGYTRQDWYDMFRKLFTRGSANEGVLSGVDAELVVTGSASPLSVAAGAAVGYGFFFEDPTATSLPVATPAATTGGRVSLRVDWASQTVRPVAILNTSGVTTPPTLVQTLNTTWDIPLATFSITNTGGITLTDARQYCHFATRVSAAMIDNGAVGPAAIAANAVGAGQLAGGAALTNLGFTPVNRAGDTMTSALGIAPTTVQPPFVLGANALGRLVAGLNTEAVQGVSIAPIQRQGGNATKWNDPGTNNYTPTNLRIQVGSASLSIINGATFVTVTVTFPVAFSAEPAIFLTFVTTLTDIWTISVAPQFVPTPNSFDIRVARPASGGPLSFQVNWLAIGPT